MCAGPCLCVLGSPHSGVLGECTVHARSCSWGSPNGCACCNNNQHLDSYLLFCIIVLLLYPYFIKDNNNLIG